MPRHDSTDVKRKNGKQSYNTTIFPKAKERNDDIYVITQSGDRLDLLAFQFYGDPSFWWHIANSNGLNTMNVKAGTRLRIPINKNSAIGR